MAVMKLPMVMPANNVKTARELNREYPGRLGVLLTPGNWEHPSPVPFVLDNGRYSSFHSGKKWNENKYFDFLRLATEVDYDPLWIVVPDTPQNGEATIEEWNVWAKRLQSYGWNLALAVQNGMTPAIVRSLDVQPDVVFVGGTTEWKWRYAKDWCREFDRVHVGRVGTENKLWRAHRVGAESSDSNVWRPIGQHLISLRRYLEGSEKPEVDNQRGFGLI